MTSPLHVVCPHCDTVNRIPGDRLEERPKCGKCKRPLFTGEPVELNALNFPIHLNRSDLPLVVDFWAPWCGPCKMMAPAFAQATAQLEPRVRLAKVNTEEEQVLAGQYGIRSIPTLVLFKNGEEVVRQPGAMGAADIVRWVHTYL